MPLEPLLKLPRQCYNLPPLPFPQLYYNPTKQRITCPRGNIIADLPDMTADKQLTNKLGELFAYSPEMAVELVRYKSIVDGIRQVIDDDLTLCNPVLAQEKLARGLQHFPHRFKFVSKLKSLNARLQLAWITCIQILADCWHPRVEHWKGQAEALNRVRDALQQMEGRK